MYFSKIFYKKGLALPAKNTHGMHQRWRITYRSRLLIVHWFVRIGNSTSTEQYTNGSIPQGTKLAPILFAVMVSDLISTLGPKD